MTALGMQGSEQISTTDVFRPQQSTFLSCAASMQKIPIPGYLHLLYELL
jgi:hypothetical protein